MRRERFAMELDLLKIAYSLKSEGMGSAQDSAAVTQGKGDLKRRIEQIARKLDYLDERMDNQ